MSSILRSGLYRAWLCLALVSVMGSMVGSSMPVMASPVTPENDLRIDVDPETGTVTFIGSDPDSPFRLPETAMDGVAIEDLPVRYLEHFGDMLGLGAPARELQVMRQQAVRGGGRSSTRFQQVYKGVPILAGELIVNLDEGGALLSISGEVSPDLDLSVEPIVTAGAARETARAAIAKGYELAVEDLEATQPELWIFDERLLRPSARPAELVWRVEVHASDGQKPINELVLINAERGGLSLHFNQIDTSWGDLGQGDPYPGLQLDEVTPTSSPALDPTPTPQVDPTPVDTEEPPITEPTPTVEPTIFPTATSTQPQSITGQPTPTSPPQDLGTGEPLPNVPFEGFADGITYYVKPGGNDSLDCLTPAMACATIQGAADKAADNDILRVAVGTYTASIEYVITVTKHLLLSGGWATDFSAQIGFSTIDGQNARKGVGIGSGITSEIEFFRIENGMATGTGGRGGGLYNSGNLTLRNCIVKDNTANFNGGGIFNATDTLLIEDSEISGNYSVDTGGAMLVQGGTVTIRNSTISGNVSDVSAGGIFTAGDLTLNNVTMASNTAALHGGALISGSGGSVTMSNTLLADNAASVGPDCTAPTPITSLGYNLIEDTTACAFTPVTGDITGVDPGLLPLTGSPAYHPFAPASAIVDMGNPAAPGSGGGACEILDQRGLLRPIDGDEDGNSQCDIGAIELELGIVDRLELYSGSGQRASLASAFSIPFQARVFNEFGFAQPGVEVNFTAPTSGPSGIFVASGTHITSTLTDDLGVAKASIFTANTLEGIYSVSAIVVGVVESVDFQLENYIPVVQSIEVHAGSGQSVEPLATFLTPLQALVRDQFDAPLIGETVTFMAPSSGPSGTFADSGTNVTTALTGVDGVAKASDFSANAEEGIYIVEASVVGVPVPAEFTLENLDLIPTSIEVYAGSGQIAEPSTTFEMPLQALVRDQFGDPFVGETVNFMAPTSGASGTFADSGTHETMAVTGADGVASSSEFEANNEEGQYTVVAHLPGLIMPAKFILTNAYGIADSVDVSAGSGQHAPVLTEFQQPLQAIVYDQFGRPIQSVIVTFDAPVSGASGTFADSGTTTTTAETNVDGIAIAADFTANAQPGQYVVSAMIPGGAVPAAFHLYNGVFDAWTVRPDGDDLNDCHSPVSACASINAVFSKPEFQSGDIVKVALGTYKGTGAEIVLINQNVTLSGGWDPMFVAQAGLSTIDGEGNRRGITTSDADVVIENFSIRNGRNSEAGGIHNAGGSLTLRRCEVVRNASRGIFSSGILVVVDSSVSDNIGGGGTSGAGLYVYGTTRIINSAVSGNTTQYYGGGVSLRSGGVLDVYNSTIVGNSAEDWGGGIRNGGGVITLQNSIVAHNTASIGPDCSGGVISSGYNLLTDATGCSFTSSTGDLIGVDPLLGPLMNSPGYHPLSSLSPAVDSANPAGCDSSEGLLTEDQRGAARVGICDRGSYEFRTPSTPERLVAVNGDLQRAAPLDDFRMPLQAAVLDAIGSPVEGVTITFTAPSSGPSGTFASTGTLTTTAVSDEFGVAPSSMFTANDELGIFVVNATAPGVGSTAEFWLTNVLWYVSHSGDDSNDCLSTETPCATFPGVLTKLTSADTVLVAEGFYPRSHHGPMNIYKDVNLLGGWDVDFTTQEGITVFDGERLGSAVYVARNTQVHMENFIIQNGLYTHGGGIRNSGNLSLHHCTVQNNVVEDREGHGAGIFNDAQAVLTLSNVSISGNQSDGMLAYGGGLSNEGSATLDDVTVYNNEVVGSGSGISNTGSMTLNYVTVHHNKAKKGHGGGISNGGTMVLNNATVSNNRAPGGYGGGINNGDTLYLNNVTVSGNHARYGGGIRADYSDPATIQNSIIAGNTAEYGPDCYNRVASLGFNLLGDSNNCYMPLAAGDLVDVNPGLGPLVGQIGTHPLISSSPAIDAGNPAGCSDHMGMPLTTDQRGIARVGICDIGSFEYVTPGPLARIQAVSGTPQRVIPGSVFEPLAAAVGDSDWNVVPGITVTFTAPASGPSGTFSDTGTEITSGVSGEDGMVTAATFTANNLPGSYSVLAMTAGIAEAAIFELANVYWYVAADGDDGLDCSTPVTACASIEAVLDKPDYVPGETILVTESVITGTENSPALTLSDDKDPVIRGGWDESFASQVGYSVIDGEHARTGLEVQAFTESELERFIIQNGGPNADSPGAGIENHSSLILRDCIVRNNRSSTDGGGISGGALTLINTIVQGNRASGKGGGIYLPGDGIFINSAVVDNQALPDEGGGIYVAGSFTLVNSTVAGNQARSGGGIHVDRYNRIYIYSSSIVENRALDRGGGINNEDDVTIQNSILDRNIAAFGQDCFGPLDSAGYNLIGATSDCIYTSGPGDLVEVDGALGTLVIPKGYIPILPDSPAVDGGNPAGCLDHEGTPITTDQRGVSRPGICDIGAYEHGPSGAAAGILPVGGDGQRRPPGTTFGEDLSAFVYDVDGNPVEGINVTFTAPASGASGTFEDSGSNVTSAVSGADGIARAAPLQADAEQGIYIVTASIDSPPGSADFNLGNIVWYVSPAGSDALECRQVATACATLQGVLNKLDFTLGDTVRFESGVYTQATAQVILINKDVVISGGWNTDFTNQSGISLVDCENRSQYGILIYGAYSEVEHFQIERCRYSGVRNEGWAVLNDVVLNDNHITNENGGGVFNAGSLELRNSMVQENSAFSGGGVASDSFTYTLIGSSTIQNNRSNEPSAYGSGGIQIYGTLIIQQSTITANHGTHGGGIKNGGTLVLVNSTISGNVASLRGGGVYNHQRLIVRNSTISGNQSGVLGLGGGIYDSGDFIMVNSILARNVSSSLGGHDCQGSITSSEFSIIGNSAGCTVPPSGSTLTDVGGRLGSLQNNGGSTDTHALLLGSPAIDSGNPAPPGSTATACEHEDQRGVPRPQGAACDMGAYEGSQEGLPFPLLLTYTAENDDDLPGTYRCSHLQTGCTAGVDPHADAAHIHAAQTFDFFAVHHDRDSMDDKGMPILSTVHYQSGYHNAFWTGEQVVYGDAYGYPLADDVVAHELTHGVTDYSSNLYYYYQSGAISESFSDLWGEFVDLTNGYGDDSPGVRWLMGEDVSGKGAIRDLRDPPNYGDPDKMTSPNYYTGSADLFYFGDNGGVHTNSGVNNKAVYLMTDGDSFNGKIITGLGLDKVAAIYYEVQTTLLTSGSDYRDLYNALYQGCLNLVGGVEGITLADCAEVRDATDAVEMNLDPAPDYNPEVVSCVHGEVHSELFFDDFESGVGNWMSDALTGTDSWFYSYSYASSGTRMLYGSDQYPLSDSYAAIAVDIPLPAGERVFLTFDHAFGFEDPNWDGGWLEYSTNGGVTWNDAGSMIEAGLDYKGTISGADGNPNGGHVAYVGDSHGYGATRLNLSSLAGKDMRFRWRMSIDNRYRDVGWVVDDVRIYTCRGHQPAPADFSGDEVSEIVVFRGGAWRFFDYGTAAFDYGVWTGTFAGCIPAPMDYDGDGGVEFTQLCDGGWHFYDDAGTYVKGIWTGGVPGDLPVPADYDGDGDDDVVIWRAGAWRFFDFESGAFNHGIWTGSPPHWLGGTNIPAPMDYDGDGKVEFTVFSGGPWHFFHEDGSYHKGLWTGGVAGDLPVPADYDGDGMEEIVIWRSGAWRFFDFNSGLFDHGVWTGSPPHWLGGTSLPAPLDVDGDGVVDFTVYSGGPWHFFNGDGSYVKGIWTGGVAGDLPISRRLLP